MSTLSRFGMLRRVERGEPTSLGESIVCGLMFAAMLYLIALGIMGADIEPGPLCDGCRYYGESQFPAPPDEARR